MRARELACSGIIRERAIREHAALLKFGYPEENFASIINWIDDYDTSTPEKQSNRYIVESIAAKLGVKLEYDGSDTERLLAAATRKYETFQFLS